MFESWGRIVYRRRRLVLVIALIGVAFAAVWGTGVFGTLQSSGGFTAPNSQSQQSSNVATAAFGQDAGNVVVLYTSPTLSVRSPAFRAAVTQTLAALPHSKVASYRTYWSTGSPQFISAGGRATYAVLAMQGPTRVLSRRASTRSRTSLTRAGCGLRSAGSSRPTRRSATRSPPTSGGPRASRCRCC